MALKVLSVEKADVEALLKFDVDALKVDMAVVKSAVENHIPNQLHEIRIMFWWLLTVLVGLSLTGAGYTLTQVWRFTHP
jgi:hypothetical protein